jgi:group I intron endonuclease
MNIGVYKIINKINKKFYIGSTSTMGFDKRWKKHILDLNKNKHHSFYLQKSWNKYGPNNFSFEIIEECIPEKCIIREQYYLDSLKPEYNICQIAGSTFGIKYKLKKIRRGEDNPFYGKHHTEKIKNILRKKCPNRGKENGMYGKGYKLKGKKNGAFKGNYIFFHKDYGKVILPQNELVETYHLDQGAVNRICNGVRKYHHDWICLGKSN